MSQSIAGNTQLVENSSIDFKTNLNNLSVVSCDTSAKNCIAIGISNSNLKRSVYKTEDGGITWTKPTYLPAITEVSTYDDELANISLKCDEQAIKCMAAHNIIIDKTPRVVVYKSNDGGISWSVPEILKSNISTKSRDEFGRSGNKLYYSHIKISCDPSVTNCTIVGGLSSTKVLLSMIYSTKDSGLNWMAASPLEKPSHSSPSSLIHGTSLLDVDCDETGKQCKAVGNTIARNSYLNDYYASLPIVYSSSNGGKKWGKPKIMPTKIKLHRGDALISASCNATGQNCTTMGYTYYGDNDKTTIFYFQTFDGGNKWGTKKLIKTPEDTEFPVSLTCDVNNKKCVVISYYSVRKNGVTTYKPVLYTSVNNKKWDRNIQNISRSSIINDIACNTEFSSCVAVGAYIK